jgi:uncharacterized circularly permuted ATP-grasp superfamily protein/uncharacterized alpha-E superfamily protein
MIDPDGALRAHWQGCVSMLDELGERELARRWEHARRIIHDNGVTHNVYGDPNGLDRPWNLDLIPLLIPPAEWQRVRQGLIQRARLLDCLLADLYGPMTTILGGMLPPELVWSNAGFLRACHGVMPPQGRWLHLYAADLVRTPDGQFEVLSDRTQAPSGAGYSLENRIALSRSMPSVFRRCNVQRLAPFFGSLRDTLSSMAPPHRENPRIVLLTPGPYNETYFEHSYLAQYLGYSLVQGNDLTVRDAKVYIKTVGGLQPVDVILRRVDDDFCDPLELNAGSYLGVPGLLQSVRQGNVTVANALGAGLLQAPGFLPFLPGMCRHFLGEELLLPSVPTWWCGQPAELAFVLENLHEMVIKSAYPTRGADPLFGHDLTREQLTALAEQIKAHPERYVAQNPVMSCTTPALIENQVQPRRFVLRAYLTAAGNSYTVMDGGLTRITPSNASLVVSLQHGGGSKDTWILSDAPVSQVSLLASGSQPIPFSRGPADLPSRIADDTFWLGRYVERTEAQVRLARAVFGRISDGGGVEETRAAQVLAGAFRESTAPNAYSTEFVRDFMGDVLGDKEGEGIRDTVIQVHGLARILRERLPADAWRNLQEAYQAVLRYEIDPVEPVARWTNLLNNIVTALAAFTGLIADSMMRSQSWRFLDMGRRIERALFVTQLLSDTLVNPGNDPVLLEAILEITESAFPYRRRYLTHLETHAVANLVLAEESNPHSVAFQLATIAEHLNALPRDATSPDRDHGQHLLLALRASIRAADLMDMCALPTDVRRDGLKDLLSIVLDETEEISDAIAHLYFSHATVSRALGHGAEEFSG